MCFVPKLPTYMSIDNLGEFQELMWYYEIYLALEVLLMGKKHNN